MKKPGPEDPPELHARYQRKLQANLKSYRKRYDNDKEFHDREIERNRTRIMNEYNNDPEKREYMKQRNLSYYYRKKAEAEQGAQAEQASQ